MVFIGLDLTSSGAKPTAAVGLDSELRVAFCELLDEDAEIIAAIENIKPEIVAIDAPLSLPQGLHCLEKNCPCPPPRAFSSAELALRKLGIGSFITSKNTIIKEMVKRGLGFQSQLMQRGYKVIEVYPYASKVRLWGKPIPKKTTPEGMAFLHNKLSALLPSLRPFLPELNHDMADAALAAYTAYLYSQGKAEMVGRPEDGQICIP